MAQELESIIKNISKEKPVILKKNFKLFQRNFVTDAGGFLKETERLAKSKKRNSILLVALITD